MSRFKLTATMMMTVALYLGGCATTPSGDASKEKLMDDGTDALRQMKADDSSLDAFLNHSRGYVIFPHVGKGAYIVGGSYGHGLVYENGMFVGYADISQATIGLQVGGQSFMELLAFETERDLNRFKDGKFTFAANASAVALKTGAGATAKYTDGVAAFTKPIGGLMVEASVGGQQFTYAPK